MDNAPRRILCMLENAGAGSGRHVLDLCRALTQRGHSVSLLYSRRRLEGWFERELATIASGDATAIDMRSGMGPRDLVSLAQVRRFLRTHGPFDVVHGHSSKAGALARLATGSRRAVRVYTPHALYTLGCAPGSVRGRFFGLLERLLAVRCEGIICVSSAERRHALANGLPTEKLFTVPNGLAALQPVDRQAVRRRMGLERGQVAIGFVGRLARQKAVHRLVAAFAEVARSQERARLVVVGDGPDAAAARAQAAGLGVADRIIWTGVADGPEAMAAFDVFALCSLYEAFPYVLLEAMARGLPVVSTRVGGVDELLGDGSNGVVVEQDDADGLRRALADLAGDAERRRAMGERSLAIVRDYDVDTMVDRTLGVYATLLGRRRNSQGHG